MRNPIRIAILSLLLATCSAILPAGAAAQDNDPPGRVGRLNYMQGAVSFQVAGQTDWVQADVNRPLTTGDNLWADKDSRGELHIESTAIRLSSETGLSFLNLDDRTVQLELPQGTIEIHVRQLPAGDAFEIDTPNLAFTLTRAGEYLITASPDGNSTSIVVREGEGEVTGGGDSWRLLDGARYTFIGTDQLSYEAQSAPGFNDFEAWSQQRDQRENTAVSARYVSRDVDGYYDLDEYGDWNTDADYGAVWFPRGVAVDWVPYHYGHWVYIAPWGWTWVDEEPWGFAPFHYGRWAMFGGRWGWVPGPVVQRPVYAPALVGFVGGGGFSFSVAIGSGFTGVAWFPLGPRDVFVPAYRCSPHYVQVVNVTNTRVVNVTQVTNVYNTVIVKRDVTHVNYMYGGNVRAVTAVSRETFVNARPVAREVVHVNERDFHDARIVSNTAIAPTRTSYVAANARVVTTRPAVPFAQRPAVVNMAPRAPADARDRQQPATGFHSFEAQDNRYQRQQSAPDTGSQRSFNRTNPPQRAPSTMQPAPTSGGQPNGAASQNDSSRTFSRPMQPERGINMQTAPSVNSGAQPNNNSNPNNSGFRSFGGNRGGNGGGNSGNTAASSAPSNNQPPQQGAPPDQQRYRFNPPVRARDQNYDVHAPLNQNQNPPQAPQQHAQPQQQAPAQQPQQNEHRDGGSRQQDNDHGGDRGDRGRGKNQ